MGYLTLVILLFLFSFLIYRNIFKADISRTDLLIGWGIKISFSLVFILIFSYHFSSDGVPYGDIRNFLNDAKVLTDFGKEDPVGYLKLMLGIQSDDPEILTTALSETQIWDYGITGDMINDNRLIIRINSVIHLFSFQNIWVHVLCFAFLSFFGVVLIYRSFSSYTQHKRLLFYALLATPTFAFWGSGITKETVFVLSFGVFVFGITQFLQRRHYKNIIFILIGAGMLLFNKTHTGLVLIPLIGFVFIAYKTGLNRKIIAGFLSVLILSFVVLNFTPPRFNVVDRLSAKQSDLINVAQGGIFFINDTAFCAFDYQHLDHFQYYPEDNRIQVTEKTSGEYKPFGQREFYPFEIEKSPRKYEVYLVIPPSDTYVDVAPIEGSSLQLLKNIPAAIFNVMFRPLPTDPGSNFKHIAFVENLGFIAFLIFAFIRRKKLSEAEKTWLFYLLSSAVILILVIGWTTPIVGAIVRYKMVAQLLLILSAFILLRKEKPIKT